MNKTDVLLSKTTMCLVWHNCKTCLPKEEQNNDLYLWDGYNVFPVEYSNGHFFDNANPIHMDYPEDFWWADLTLTTKRFFILGLGMEGD